MTKLAPKIKIHQKENYLNFIVKLIKHIEIGLLARPPQEPAHVPIGYL
jgi:hypothetical protein